MEIATIIKIEKLINKSLRRILSIGQQTLIANIRGILKVTMITSTIFWLKLK